MRNGPEIIPQWCWDFIFCFGILFQGGQNIHNLTLRGVFKELCRIRFLTGHYKRMQLYYPEVVIPH